MKNPTPIGSRPSDLDLIGLCRQNTKPDPPTHKERQGRQGNPNQKEAAGKGAGLFKKETENL